MEMAYKASVKYGDYAGTAAADRADDAGSLLKALEGVKRDDEKIVGFSLSFGEIFPSMPMSHFVYVYLYSGETPYIEVADPVPLRVVRLDITLEDFFRNFKRFEVVLSRFGIMDGRTYDQTNTPREAG